jgi:hypothetical protein
MPNTTDLQIVNSLTYADVAGLQFGLPRLPGEETPTYVERLYHAAISRRDHGYEGMLDSLVLEFGLHQTVAGQISNIARDTTMAIAPGRLLLNGTTIPTVTLDGDHYLAWRTLGDIFADINAVPGFSAVLQADAGLPAMQLARQGNVFTVINEPVGSGDHTFAHVGVIAGSLRFNIPASGWAMNDDVLTFTGTIPAGLVVSYQYRANPFDVVISEVGLFSLADPSLGQVAVGDDSVLAYQVREFIQAVMMTDRSYWSK